MRKHFNPLLYAILDRELLGKRSLIQATKDLIAGGATMIQLRKPKGCLAKDFLADAQKVKSLLKNRSIKFIINDRPDIALAVNGDGVHVGQDDLPIKWARKILGKSKIIGVSVVNLKQAKQAQKSGADYLGVGAVFKTATKPDARCSGLQTLKRIKKVCRVPVVAIGGINHRNVGKVIAAGADGIAACSALLKAGSICKNTRHLKKAILLTRMKKFDD